jgi:virginiamycin B lyase
MHAQTLRQVAGPWRAILLIAAILVCLALAARAEAFIYWANFNSGTIGRANLDGTGVHQSFITGADNPVGVAVDASHIYWANEGFLSGTTIGRANLDGTGVDQSFISGAESPAGVAVDGSHVYWANEGGDSIGRANLDGTGVDQSFIRAGNFPCGPAVDSSHIYWANEISGEIRSADLDGTHVNRHLVDPGFGTCPVTVDAAHIYWAHITSIGRAKLNGKRVDRSFIASQNITTGVAVDAAQIYWTNFNGTIGRANLDGTGRNHTFICGGSFPAGIAVDALSAQPLQSPSSDISFCPVKRNERKGTAKLVVNVDGPGRLELVKTTKVKRAEQTVEAAGTHKLLVKPKGKAKRRLNGKGKATVKASVTYTPTGGSPQTERKRIKLVKRR